jgi:hypothetical protein
MGTVWPWVAVISPERMKSADGSKALGASPPTVVEFEAFVAFVAFVAFAR